ncbi:hypothetical protein ACFV0C_08805 [Streptomyces sp. NPDC059568]|uniref:hypothetical protein n=1 Tax=Streptomyces sp. NPDC059568 TaxID=3346868 RepID=UPI00368E319A
MTVLVPVGADGLLTADVTGHGDLVLPVGNVEDHQTPEEAAQLVLPGAPNGLPILRRVAVDQVQMRRRKVVTHIVVTSSLTQKDAMGLAYRDPRAILRVLHTTQAVAELPERARARALLGLQALAIGVMAYLEDGTVQRLESVATYE